MDKFDFVLILLSFVFAMAMGHLLAGVGALVSARERVRFSPLLTLAILNALLQTFVDWLALWDLRSLPEWDLLTIAVIFTYPIVIYFLCVAAVPEPSREQPVDMEAFYWKTRRLYYGLFSLLLLIFMGGSWVLLPFLLLCLLALFVPARWAQWTAGVALLLLTVGWSILFTSTIR